ncbi:MAG: DUF2000 family protein [Rhizobiaceae bacterium]|nr:DUF2000 family protein [Rhizobiaceae bacterium]
MFDTKIAIIVREDLMSWQKLNVTAFLSGGLVGQNPDLVGERYQDGSGQSYSSLIIQPIIVLTTDANGMAKIHKRAISRGVDMGIYVEEMFVTEHDAANRATITKCPTDDLKLVGIAMRADRKVVDKITKGAKMHP